MNKIKVIPDILIGGGANGGSALEGIMGMQLVDMMKKNIVKTDETPVTPSTVVTTEEKKK